MKILEARNVHDALPQALALLDQHGIQRNSRNGPVLVAPWPVCTIYSHPWERVIFWPERDANPFFHLYEALWMLAGRNDVAGPARYAKQIAQYSDDGKILHGAYGHRWRNQFGDQLATIAERLQKNSEDRRCVLQMWDTRLDLGLDGKDHPCNLTATFQRNADGALELTVFCRSNDILWGCYGANAVHFSLLQEYMALWIGCPMGVYRQISVNWHAYLNTLEKVKALRPDRLGFVDNPYTWGRVHPAPLSGNIERANELIALLLEDVDNGFPMAVTPIEPWAQVAYLMLRAHDVYRQTKGADRYALPLDILAKGDPHNDWLVAGREWIQRRQTRWEQAQDSGVRYE